MSDDNDRLEDVLAPSFTQGLGDLPDDELRMRLRTSREEEYALSYVRRILHGRLDILWAELEVRRAGRGTELGIEALLSALSDGGNGTSRGARPKLATPSGSTQGRRRAERVVPESHLARIDELDVADIQAIIQRVAGEERLLSAERHRLHEVIDALETELADRYKSGVAAPPV